MAFEERCRSTFGAELDFPVNRKERFYTATVFPGIIFSDNLERLLKLIGVNIACDLDGSNIVLYTEYDLKDAIVGDSRRTSAEHQRARRLHGDTPDVVILAKDKSNRGYAIAIEGKMFSRITKDYLKDQVSSQRKVLEHLTQNYLNEFQILQFALIPDQLAQQFEDGRQLTVEAGHVQIFTWQQLLDAYQGVAAADYWRRMLGCALERYDALRAKQIYRKVSGKEIQRRALSKDCDITFIGREGGLSGINKDLPKKMGEAPLLCQLRRGTAK